MKVIFAQGNPGNQYTKTRHNVGFRTLDTLAKSHLIDWSEKSKFSAKIAEYGVGDEKVLLVKPLTFYNDSGLSARKITDFYNLDVSKDILIIHDDLALPLGTIRTREKGSDAGNNGIKSLNQHIGSDYHRIRIGIWNELRERMDASDFVLGSFNKKESDKLNETIIPHALEIIDSFCNKNLKITSKKL